MKRNILIFGAIPGLIMTGFAVYAASACYANPAMETNDVVGYVGIIVVFAFIFVGIKNYRDRFNNGVITFGQGFKTGLYMSLVASSIYVLVWLVDYYLFIPEYLDRYIEHVMIDSRRNGATEAELAKTAERMDTFRELYKNPLFVVVSTFLEVFPFGLIISLVSAFLLKKGPKENVTAESIN